MRYQHGVIASLLLALMVACGPTAEEAEPAPETTAEAGAMTTSDADRAGIDDAIEKLQEAFATADIEMLVSSYTDDVVYMGADSPMVRGDEAMRADNEPLSAYEDDLINDEVVATGNWGYALGTFAGNGKYLMIMKRQPDGSWKIAREIWNVGPPAEQ